VLPFSVGMHPATVSPFAVLAFPGSDHKDLVYVESHLGGHLEKEQVRKGPLRCNRKGPTSSDLTPSPVKENDNEIPYRVPL